jgi:hypothetical protein
MDGSLSPRQFRPVVRGISPRRVPSKSWKRNELIIRVCTARSSILAGTPPLPTPMRTCRSRPGANLFRRQCITSCGSQVPTECIPDIYGLSGFAPPCPDAGTIRDSVLQFSQCWHTGHGVRKDANRAQVGQSRPTFQRRPNRFGDPRFDPRFAPPPPPWWWR